MSCCPTCGAVMATKQDPTRAQARVLDFVIAFRERHDRFPIAREIATELRYRTRGSVHYHIRQLALRGLITLGGQPGGGMRRIIGARRAP